MDRWRTPRACYDTYGASKDVRTLDQFPPGSRLCDTPIVSDSICVVSLVSLGARGELAVIRRAIPS
jgi:hypothetical protein